MSLPKPYWQDEKRGLRIFLGDCRVFLPLFADGEFASVICDPPYGVGIADWDIPPDSAILAECLRVATGTVVMFGGADSLPTFCRLEPPPERILAWTVPFSMSLVRKSGMLYRWHPILLWRTPTEQDIFCRDFIETRLQFRTHLSHKGMKPEPLMRDLCSAFGGPSVLDPYLGSGTTLAACAKLGIPGTGIEISEAYCEMAAARLSEDLSYGEPNLFNRDDAEG